jgi:hypothetical protein
LRELLASTSKGRGGAPVYLYLAARELGDASQADLRERMCRVLEPGSGVSTASGGAGSLVRGLILGNCGRTADARQTLEAAILAADRNLSLYLAREALASLSN